MPWDELFVEPDESDGSFVLRREADACDHTRGTVFARDSLSRDQLVAAITATPWATIRGGRLVLDRQVACSRLAAAVEEMLSCFTRDGSPDARLSRIRSFLADDDAESIDADRLSWWHCAWLDVAVREDAADLARSAADLWSTDELAIELDAIRRRRVLELASAIARSRPATGEQQRRLAESARTRRVETKRRRKGG